MECSAFYLAPKVRQARMFCKCGQLPEPETRIRGVAGAREEPTQEAAEAWHGPGLGELSLRLLSLTHCPGGSAKRAVAALVAVYGAVPEQSCSPAQTGRCQYASRGEGRMACGLNSGRSPPPSVIRYR